MTGFLKSATVINAFLALVSGISLSFIQSPYEYWALIFPCFSLFYILYYRSLSVGQAFWNTYLFSLGYFTAGLNWIGNALLVEGNEYWWVWPLAVIGLPLLLSLFSAIYMAIARIMFRQNSFLSFLAFCTALGLAEFVRSFVFTGFPWNLYGYGWIGVIEVAQAVRDIGPFWLTFLTVVWGSLIGALLIHRYRFKLATLSLMAYGLLAFFYMSGQTQINLDSYAVNKQAQLHLVQPNIAQVDKWDPAKLAENFEQHIKLSSLDGLVGKNIIIWPETALPPALLHNQAVEQRLRRVLTPETILLTGALGLDGDQNYFNSLMVWQHEAGFQRLYDKSHLVPFGEYIPFQDLIPLKPVAEFSGFTKGSGPQTIKLDGYPSFSPQICYEIIFPHKMIGKGQKRPDFLLTITNDAWYGISPGPYQHFTQARFRAIETGIPVIRVANTGISGVIDPYGRVFQRLELNESGVISAFLPQKLAK